MDLLNLTVPQDMCALDFLANMKELTKHAWIYLHVSVISNLLKTNGIKCESRNNNLLILSWKSTAKYSTKRVIISPFEAKGWYTVIAIDSKNIAFKEIDNIEDPECIIRLKMSS